jgi:putative redox protein
MAMSEVEARGLGPRFQVEVKVGDHAILADEPAILGGADVGPAPHDFLLVALGACTAITVRMYAERKEWALTGIRVHLEQEASPGGEHQIRRVVRLEGALDDAQRARLLEIADKCPVHQILTHPIRVTTELAAETPAKTPEVAGP